MKKLLVGSKRGFAHLFLLIIILAVLSFIMVYFREPISDWQAGVNLAAPTTLPTLTCTANRENPEGYLTIKWTVLSAPYGSTYKWSTASRVSLIKGGGDSDYSATYTYNNNPLDNIARASVTVIPGGSGSSDGRTFTVNCSTDLSPQPATPAKSAKVGNCLATPQKVYVGAPVLFTAKPVHNSAGRWMFSWNSTYIDDNANEGIGIYPKAGIQRESYNGLAQSAGKPDEHEIINCPPVTVIAKSEPPTTQPVLSMSCKGRLTNTVLLGARRVTFTVNNNTDPKTKVLTPIIYNWTVGGKSIINNKTNSYTGVSGTSVSVSAVSANGLKSGSVNCVY